MTKFNIGDILANYSGGLDKPAYEVLDNINGLYRLKQIPTGNYFTWDYATVERANALYAPVPTDPCAGITCPNGCWGTSLYSKKCVDGQCVKDTLIKSNAPECGYTPPPPINCETGGCGLLNLYDIDNDGKVTSSDALRAQNDGRTTEEVQFILAASAAGSINAKCPECYTPVYIPKFSVGDHVCTTQPELIGYSPAVIDTIYDDGSYRAVPTTGSPFKMTPDWEKYFHICTPAELDPCTGVTCSNTCDGTSLYSQKCSNGHCIKDALIKSNAPECGYTPPYEEPDDEPFDEPDDEVPDLMPGQTCVGSDLHQLITGGLIGDLIEANSPKCPSAPPEDKGIFGDLDTKWIIIAVIALIILGLLS